VSLGDGPWNRQASCRDRGVQVLPREAATCTHLPRYCEAGALEDVLEGFPYGVGALSAFNSSSRSTAPGVGREMIVVGDHPGALPARGRDRT